MGIITHFIVDMKIDNIKSIADDTKAGIDKIHLLKRHDEIDAWLSPADHSTNLQRARAKRQQGSGQWFLKSPQFSTWKRDPSSFLWLNGIPGCGKTVLSSTIIEHLLGLQEDSADPSNSYLLLYFYFDFTETKKESLENAIQSLISQVYYERPLSQKHLDKLWSSCKGGRHQPSIQDLSSTFTEMLQDSGNVWVILDALDECKARDTDLRLLGWLENLHLNQENVRLLVTSRPESDIKTGIERFAKKDWVIDLKKTVIEEDIFNYIHQQVMHHNDFHRWRKHPEVQKQIEDVLREKSNGM